MGVRFTHGVPIFIVKAMSKEYNLTPLEVAQVATNRLDELHPWALSVARTIVYSVFGDKYHEKKPLEFTALQNAIATNLVIARERQL